jgi:hypothetical protein
MNVYGLKSPLQIVLTYFPPDTKPENIANYFRFLENELDFRVIMFGDFNAPGFDWKNDLSAQLPLLL